MKNFRKGMVAGLAAITVVAMLAVGCKKDQGDKGKEGDTAGQKAEKGDSQASGNSGDKGAAASKTSFAVFPKNSEFVVGINGDSLRKSGLFQQFKPMLDAKLAADKDFQGMKEACGFDPIEKVKSVIIGGNTTGDGVVVVKGFERSEAKDCAQKVAAKKGEDVKIEEDGKLMKLTNKGDVVWVGWMDDHTIVTGSGAEGDGGKDWVQARLTGADGLDKNEDLMKLLGQVDSSGTVWFIAQPKDTSKMAMMGAPPSAMFGTVLLTDGLKVDAGLRYGKPEDAKAFVDQGTQMMGAMASDPTSKMLADKTKLEVKGNDAIIKVDLSKDELAKVMAMAQGMMGAMFH